MAHLNAPPRRRRCAHGVRAATDITGFGLVGHASAIARESRAHPRDRGPRRCRCCPSALELAPTVPGGRPQGQPPAVRARSRIPGALDPALQALLFDPQTSGGLLAPGRRPTVLSALARTTSRERASSAAPRPPGPAAIRVVGLSASRPREASFDSRSRPVLLCRAFVNGFPKFAAQGTSNRPHEAQDAHPDRLDLRPRRATRRELQGRFARGRPALRPRPPRRREAEAGPADGPAEVRAALERSRRSLQDNAELMRALTHPGVPVLARKQDRGRGAVRQAPEVVKRLVHLLVERDRVLLLPAISEAYAVAWNEARGVSSWRRRCRRVDLDAGQKHALSEASPGPRARPSSSRPGSTLRVLGGLRVSGRRTHLRRHRRRRSFGRCGGACKERPEGATSRAGARKSRAELD